MEKPSFINHREELWKVLLEEHKEFVSKQERNPIVVTLKDHGTLRGISWESTPYSLVCGIDKKLADNVVIAKVNGILWDLDRPLEDDCELEVLDFEDKEAKYVFWHSSAHILGEAMEIHYSGHLCYGPPVENGFYYDMYLEDGQVKPDDYKPLETKCKKIIKERQRFERLEVDVERLKEMFYYNEFKCRILNERVKSPRTTIYKCGDLIDLCLGPHVRNTGKVKAMAVVKSSASYWEGDANRESLQRIYGISFPNAQSLEEWKKFQEEAAKRDHRKIGTKQNLFMFHEYSPGSCFFKPKGTVIYRKLENLIRDEYFKRGFSEVITPNIFNAKLWETSGHWEHYSDNMFKIDVDKTMFGMKPMNCPAHCLMFRDELRSYKELPLRLADFGALHRNEASGALTGLTRVRRFQQDDAHIFCMEKQITTEIMSCLEFMQHIYCLFGFDFKLMLSTRPETFLGDVEVWNKAEEQLKEALNQFGKKWELNEGDGAFYGPKIDITITDALRRHHQCATIQLDFQLPLRFDLNYMVDTSEGDYSEGDGSASTLNRPVIIHRAILGSVERLFAILTESFAGKWPFWLSPFQAIVLSFNADVDEYAVKVRDALRAARFHCDIDIDSGRTIKKKIKLAQEAQYNFMLVVGKKELENGTVNVRTRDEKVHGEHTISHVIERFRALEDCKTLNAEAEF